MKCLICGRFSLPGAKLCLDCKAARKRAFDATVTQPLLAAAGAARGSSPAARLLKPSQSVPDAARRAAKMALAAQAQSKTAAESPPPPPRVQRWPIVAGGILVLLVVVGYFGHWFGPGKSETFTAVQIEHSPTESSVAPSTVRAEAPTVAPASTGAVVPVGIDARGAEPSPSVNKADVAKRPNARSRTEKAPLPVPIPESLPAQAIAVAPPPPPVVREAPRVDPWQPMNDAIARCAANDISGRVSCEQRVRAQFCEGHWGQVPQCASIPYTDHGQ